MTNPCPAHIGCAGDCNKCSYIGGVKVKCYNEKCDSYSTMIINRCRFFRDVSILHDKCSRFMPEKDIMIDKLQAELKVYKRVTDMMGEEIHDLIYENGLDRLRYDACFTKGVGCKKGDGHCPECLVKHFITKAKEE